MIVVVSNLIGAFASLPASKTDRLGRANVVIYGLGLIWLRHALSASWSDAIAWGLTPFLVGDAVKIALAVGVLPAAWSFVRD